MSNISYVFSPGEDVNLKVESQGFNPYDLYKRSLQSREGMRDTIQTAMDAALTQLLMWERVAHANDFVVQLVTDAHGGMPYPEFDGDTVRFLQAYGVFVVDKEKESK